MTKLTTTELLERIESSKSISLKFGVFHTGIQKVQVGRALIDLYQYEAIEEEYEKDIVLFNMECKSMGFTKIEDYLEYQAISCFINRDNDSLN
ncbi:hypothetical protein ACQKMI_10615 [Lysinibacillus sp. NPDC097214]|uniref:hypothetical protein n=1 Tax=Lysinibacillus sp. NPDC097214 TaxID=3390584 RepID=UPI003D04AEF8